MKRLHHPAVGDLELVQRCTLHYNPGWTMLTFTVERDSPSENRPRLLDNLTTVPAGTVRSTGATS